MTRAPCTTGLIWSSEAVLHYRVLLCDWSFETCYYRGQEPLSDSRWSESSLWLRHRHQYTRWPYHVHIHHFHYAATEDMHGQVIINKCLISQLWDNINLARQPLLYGKREEESSEKDRTAVSRPHVENRTWPWQSDCGRVFTWLLEVIIYCTRAPGPYSYMCAQYGFFYLTHTKMPITSCIPEGPYGSATLFTRPFLSLYVRGAGMWD